MLSFALVRKSRKLKIVQRTMNEIVIKEHFVIGKILKCKDK